MGKLDASVSIDGATLLPGAEPTLMVRLRRDGTRSTYGDLRLTIGSDTKPAYFVRGVAVYVPNRERDVLVPLPQDIRKRIAGQTVRIDYVSADPSAPGIIASAAVRP